MKVKEITEANL